MILWVSKKNFKLSGLQDRKLIRLALKRAKLSGRQYK